jgi:hypothetical protein
VFIGVEGDRTINVGSRFNLSYFYFGSSYVFFVWRGNYVSPCVCESVYFCCETTWKELDENFILLKVEKWNAYDFFSEINRKRLLGRSDCRWNDDTETDIKRAGCDDAEWNNNFSYFLFFSPTKIVLLKFVHILKVHQNTKFNGDKLAGKSFATTEVRTSVFLEWLKLRDRGYLQWHYLTTGFHKNPPIVSKVYWGTYTQIHTHTDRKPAFYLVTEVV